MVKVPEGHTKGNLTSLIMNPLRLDACGSLPNFNLLHTANVWLAHCGPSSCERILVGKLPFKSQKEMGERLADTIGEENVIGENSIIFTPERTKKCLISTLLIGLYFMTDVSEMEWKKT